MYYNNNNNNNVKCNLRQKKLKKANFLFTIHFLGGKPSHLPPSPNFYFIFEKWCFWLLGHVHLISPMVTTKLTNNNSELGQSSYNLFNGKPRSFKVTATPPAISLLNGSRPTCFSTRLLQLPHSKCCCFLIYFWYCIYTTPKH